MDEIIQYTFIIIQFIALFVLVFEIMYILLLKPTKIHMQILVLIISTFITILGYTLEMFSKSVETALVAAGISYLGKPYALIMSLVFIASFTDKPLPKKVILGLSILAIVFPTLVFTNGYDGTNGHHLYYATVGFDTQNNFSPLITTHGPLYYTYMAFTIIIFTVIILYVIRAFKISKTKEKRDQVWFLLGMLVVTILGYVVYLLGGSGDYDSTMLGACIGSFLLTIVFFKYKLFDTLILAKDQALYSMTNGIIVFDENDQLVFLNNTIETLLKNKTFTIEELKTFSEEEKEVHKNDKVYTVKSLPVSHSNILYGRTIEINDVTQKYNYRTRLQHDVEERTKEIQHIQRSIVAAFAGLVEARDDSTGAHIKRMSNIVELISRDLKENNKYLNIIDDNFIECLIEVAPLHDIGKITIPDSILLKPGRLTDEEFEIIKSHSTSGANIIQENLRGVERPFYVSTAYDVAKFHHEKWNGKGYPVGLSGNDIPLSARIVAVADVYDAVRSERCYKQAMTKEQAINVIKEGSGSHFDPIIVETFLNITKYID